MNITKEKPKYQQLANEIASKIYSGIIPHGSRLAGVRDMAREYNASTAVSIAAFKVLEEQGLIEKRQGSGTFVNYPQTETDKVSVHCWNHIFYPQILSDSLSGMEKDYSNIDIISFATAEYTDYKDYISYLQELSASGGNNIVAVDEGLLPVLAENGLLEPLDSSAFKASYIRKVIDGISYNGSVYALPLGFSPSMLFYNRSLFDQAGIPNPEGAMSWEKLMDLTQTMSQIREDGFTVERYGLGVVYTINSFMPFVWQNNGEIFNRNGSCTIDSEEVYEALNFFSQLINYPGTCTHRYGDERAALAKSLLNGYCSMLIGDAVDYHFLDSRNRNEEWGVVSLPGRLSQATALSINGLAVLKGSDSPELTIQTAASLTGSEISMKICQLMNKFSAATDPNQLPPIAKEVLKTADYSLQCPAIEAFELVNDHLILPIRHRIIPNPEALKSLKNSLNTAMGKL